jgi:hypothetical protein
MRCKFAGTRLYGERPPEWQCAGYGEPISGLGALDLADSNRVHSLTAWIACSLSASAGGARLPLAYERSGSIRR